MKSEKAKIIFNLVNKNILFYSLCTFPHFSVQTGPEGRFRGRGYIGYIGNITDERGKRAPS